MSAQWDSLVAQLLATDTAVLPSSMAAYVGLRMGWSVVLAWLGVLVIARWWPAAPGHKKRLRVVALLAVVSAWLPGPYGSAYWLGLVFQAPSTLAVLLCAGLLWRQLRPLTGGIAVGGLGTGGADRAALAWVAMGVLLGWVLLLDSFALLPVQVYACGFSPITAGLVLLALLLPWVCAAAPAFAVNRWFGLCAAVVCLLVFVIWRLPTGNVWDAVLDPLLWLALHGYLLRAVLLRKRVGVY